jgi:zeaxanthin glucosyltransferase
LSEPDSSVILRTGDAVRRPRLPFFANLPLESPVGQPMLSRGPAQLKLGITVSPHNGHTNPMLALARALQARGHEAVLLGIPDIEPASQAAGIEFAVFGSETHKPGWITAHDAAIAKLRGPEARLYSWQVTMPSILDAALQELPDIIRRHGFDAMVIDKATGYFELLPMLLGLPYVQIWNSAHMDITGQSPSPLSAEPYDPSPAQRAKNLDAYWKAPARTGPYQDLARAFAATHGMAIDWSDPTATSSRLAELTQMPHAFDFPVTHWPAHFHYTAPFINPGSRAPIAFRWDRLNGKRLVYASLGTVVNDHPSVYATIFKAMSGLPDTQLVLSTGRFFNMDELGEVPPDAIVVRSAPQLDLLRRAALCITHAGHNTTLETLVCGVPMVAIPLAYDQPGLAARIAHHGVGTFVPVDELTPDRLLDRLRAVLDDPAYRERARRLGSEIARLDGPAMAAAIIEDAFQTALSER